MTTPNRSLRTYESIWIKIKATGNCRVVVPAHQQATLRKAVVKEKWKDVVWKFEADGKWILRTEVKKDSVLFYLVPHRLNV